MAGDFQDHCLVLDRREILFDPAVWVPARDGSEPVVDARVYEYGFDDVAFGYSFNRSTTTRREPTTWH